MTSAAGRERRWRMGFFVVGTIYIALLLVDFLTQRLGGFSQILIVLFLAWLLAFILSPLVNLLVTRVGLRRGLAIGLVYAGALVVGGFLLIYSLTAIARSASWSTTSPRRERGSTRRSPAGSRRSPSADSSRTWSPSSGTSSAS
jgi:hypothetical protein